MTCDDAINAIDQLIADAKDAFGEHSETVKHLRAAYKVAGKEADEIAEHQGDQQEYAAAHAHQTFTDARALNSGR